MTKSKNAIVAVTVSVPRQHASELQRYAAQLSKPAKELTDRQRTARITDAVIRRTLALARELEKLRGQIQREYERISDLHDLDLLPKSQEWLSDYDEKLSDALDKSNVSDF